MSPDLAQLALQLLNRVPLRGDEVDTFAAVRAALRNAAFPPPQPQIPESPGGTD